LWQKAFSKAQKSQTTLEASHDQRSWGRNARSLQPRPIVKPWLLELETAKEILEEIFHARPADVEEMIHMVVAGIATEYRI
jgi:hypothetical protein